MAFTAAGLRGALRSCTPAGATGYVLALSGGADSGALLRAMICVAASPTTLPLRAVHIDHGLQPAAVGFRDACARQCKLYGVPLQIVGVTVQRQTGSSLEAAARDARYAALEPLLRAGECLLTAHHREDQAETLLLQALRGSGLKGLSAMPAARRFGRGWHLRPLLDVGRDELRGFEGKAEQVPDPMNADERFERVYLRRKVWPVLERWPGAASCLARSARHAADAQALLEQSAAADLVHLRDGYALQLSRLRALPHARRINAVRAWLAERDVDAPSTARLTEALRQAFDAQTDHLPSICWGGHAMRRYRQRLFVTDAEPPRLPVELAWTGSEARAAWGESAAKLGLPGNLGTLSWEFHAGGIVPARLPRNLSVRRRVGGECLKPGRHARTQSVQHLCQQHGVLPWLRDALPLVYVGEALIAVADLWLDARWCSAAGEPGLALRWSFGPELV